MTGEPFRTPEDGLVVLVGGTEAITVPSGQDVTLQDVIWSEAGPAGLALRFRFVAPRIARMGGDIAFEVASEDMMALCQSYALPRIAEFGPAPRQVIISLAAQPLPFGEAAPDVTQYFEAYRIENGTCIWEMF